MFSSHERLVGELSLFESSQAFYASPRVTPPQSPIPGGDQEWKLSAMLRTRSGRGVSVSAGHLPGLGKY